LICQVKKAFEVHELPNLNSSFNHFEQELATMQIAAASFATQCIPNGKVRSDYIAQIEKFSKELILKVARNQITPHAAAMQAQLMRNTILEATRGRSTALGFAIAEFLKKEGPTLASLETKYAKDLYGKNFLDLDQSQQNRVWRTIVKKSGDSRASANNGAKWMGRAGRGFFVLTVVISIYHIARAEDKVRAAANEGVAVGGGAAGSVVGGTVGLVCGPAAIACVPIGIFIGGILGAYSADVVFDHIW
jgi:hypothetical protein